MGTRGDVNLSEYKKDEERVPFWAVAGCYLFVILIAGAYFGIIASDFDSIADLSLDWVYALPLLIPTFWLIIVIAINVARDCRNRCMHGYWVRSRLAPKSWLWTIVGCAAMLVFLIFVTRIGKPKRETVDGVRWRYTVSNGNAIIGCARLQNRPAISVSKSGSLTIPSTLGGCPVTGIGERAFDRCKRLTSVIIPPGVTWIGSSAFGGCRALTHVIIHGNVSCVGPYAFSGCGALKEFVVKTEGQSCKAVNGLLLSAENCLLAGVNGDGVIPDSVTSIGPWAFEGRSALTSVMMPSSVTNIEDGAFVNCSGLRSVTIPCGVQRVGIWAFMDCSNLTSVTIPNSLTSVRADAFRGCPIEKIYIEKGDAERVRELLRGKGIDVDKVEFVEREVAQPDCATSNNANGQLK